MTVGELIAELSSFRPDDTVMIHRNLIIPGLTAEEAEGDHFTAIGSVEYTPDETTVILDWAPAPEAGRMAAEGRKD